MSQRSLLLFQYSSPSVPRPSNYISSLNNKSFLPANISSSFKKIHIFKQRYKNYSSIFSTRFSFKKSPSRARPSPFLSNFLRCYHVQTGRGERRVISSITAREFRCTQLSLSSAAIHPRGASATSLFSLTHYVCAARHAASGVHENNLSRYFEYFQGGNRENFRIWEREHEGRGKNEGGNESEKKRGVIKGKGK